jgi:hypothetical protein
MDVIVGQTGTATLSILDIVSEIFDNCDPPLELGTPPPMTEVTITHDGPSFFTVTDGIVLVAPIDLSEAGFVAVILTANVDGNEFYTQINVTVVSTCS